MAIAAEPPGANLSPAARARLAQPTQGDPFPLPDLSDLAAVARWRDASHAAWGEGTMPGEAPHRPELVAGVPCDRAGRPDAPTLLYLHGGGYCLGSPGVAAPITARFAKTFAVLSVSYRLAPEHPFPAALEDVLAVLAALAAHGPVVVAGDSAGGGLALAATLAARDRAWPLPRALALLCPHLDHTVSAAADVAPLLAAYRGSTAPDHPLVSPLLASLGGLCPILVQTGTADPLQQQAVRLVQRARAEGTPVTLDSWPGLWHAWHYHRDIPEADVAVATAAAFLHAALTDPPGVGATTGTTAIS